ncbi:hypothetical protein ABIA32_002752 [Streptacidiphilus sp. MAP12-20]|uniref:hypothetical protein n=1 Tax=Streptacidiphilus sp. MAP12-20 TaxID=3156299 RepID=UPI003511B552
MIADHPTDTPSLTPRAQAAAALARLLLRHPHIADNPLFDFQVNVSGGVLGTAGVDADGALAAIHEIAGVLGLQPQVSRYAKRDGTPRVSLSAHGEFDGAQWDCVAYVRADAYDFDAFTRSHSTDPTEWSEAERAEYAALAQSRTAVAA